ncbi:MAG: hypothetical protein QXY54_05220 [Nitrososphaerota archaeon]
MKREELEPLGELFRLLPRTGVLRGNKMPELGEEVYTKDGRSIGYVSDVFGPINGFYIVVRLTSELQELERGSILYRKAGRGQPDPRTSA